MKRKKIIPFAILILVIVGSILYFDLFRKMDLSPDLIVGSGTVEVTEIEISSKIAGRILEISVEEGDRIKKNKPLVNLSYDELAPQKLSALATLVNNEKNFSRSESLFKSGSLSKQAYDNALTAFQAAKSQYDYILANISNAYLNSPIDGTVLKKNSERGELAFPGTPILVLADLTRPWIKIYVPETKIGRVVLGDAVDLTTDSFEKNIFKGKVTSISNKAEFTPKTIQTKEERVKLVFAVKVALENKDELLKPGMPADAVIHTRQIK
jgi:HlyD family secretion protein